MTSEDWCVVVMFSVTPSDWLELEVGMGWNKLAEGLVCSVRCPSCGVLGIESFPEIGLRPGYIILMSEGEGEGARDDTVLDIRDAPPTSQFCNRFRSSALVGPPSVMESVCVCEGINIAHGLVSTHYSC